jgi:hypothetical protein
LQVEGTPDLESRASALEAIQQENRKQQENRILPGGWYRAAGCRFVFCPLTSEN